jgi:hypothetical protein
MVHAVGRPHSVPATTNISSDCHDSSYASSSSMLPRHTCDITPSFLFHCTMAAQKLNPPRSVGPFLLVITAVMLCAPCRLVLQINYPFHDSPKELIKVSTL